VTRSGCPLVDRAPGTYMSGIWLVPYISQIRLALEAPDRFDPALRIRTKPQNFKRPFHRQINTLSLNPSGSSKNSLLDLIEHLH